MILKGVQLMYVPDHLVKESLQPTNYKYTSIQVLKYFRSVTMRRPKFQTEISCLTTV